jgi:hypothetical protein
VVDTVLQEYVPDWRQRNLVFCATTDSASNMVCYGKSSAHPYTWIRCFAHLLNLAVTDFISKADIDASLEKLRTLRHKFKYEKEYTLAYKTAASSSPNLKFRRLIRDVPTRWNSVMFMMRRAVQQRTVITIALANLETNSLNLTDAEWKVCEVVSNILEPFHTATVTVSSEREVTMSLPIVLLDQRLKNLRAGADDDAVTEKFKTLMKSCLEARKKEYDKHNSVAKLALALDPRFKNRKELSMPDDIKGIIENLLKQRSPRENADDNQSPQKTH